jgi:hypothetical protein
MEEPSGDERRERLVDGNSKSGTSGSPLALGIAKAKSGRAMQYNAMQARTLLLPLNQLTRFLAGAEEGDGGAIASRQASTADQKKGKKG